MIRQIRGPLLNSGETSAVAILGPYPAAPWHRLYFLPDPQGQIAFRLTTGTEPVELVRFGCGGDVAPGAPGPTGADGASSGDCAGVKEFTSGPFPGFGLDCSADPASG